MAYSAVRSNATRESVEIFRDQLLGYREGVTPDELDFAKGALIQSAALRFETLGAIIPMLNEIAVYDRPWDYVKQQGDFVQGLTLDAHRALAQRYILPDQMVYLVVGDAATQLDPLRSLGLGAPIMLDREGNPVRGN
jgi:zinc protease